MGFQKTRAFFSLHFFKNRFIMSLRSFSAKGLESAHAIQLCVGKDRLKVMNMKIDASQYRNDSER